MTIATKFGYQFLGKPPESFRAKCGGSKGIKIVGDETDLAQLRDWNVEIKQARLITAEKKVEAARDRNNLAEIPALAAELAEEFAGVDARLGVAGVWYEIPPIMPAVTPWTARWYAAAATAFRRKGLRSVLWGFATGTPQVAPWAGQGGHGPDEWPAMYDCLAVLHGLGTDWVRIGVEEYIAGGKLHPADFSNVGRIKEVYERHLRPHGWNIVFRGIEAGYDNPGMKDAGIIPQNLINGNAPAGAIEGGLALADARYAALPYVDCMFLYQVSDPVVYTNESKFAFTPGDKRTPVGYLETMQGYFAANPPAPFVAPKPSGTPTTPPPEPDPEPASAIVFENHFDSFEPRRFADGIGDIMIPPGFEVGYLKGAKFGSLHGELSPSRETGVLKPDSFIFHVMGRMNAWLRVVFPTTPGDTYRLSVETSATVDKVTRNIGLAQYDWGNDPSGLDRISITDPARTTMARERVATGTSMAAFWQVFADQPIRSDAKIHSMKIERVAVAPPPAPDFPAWYVVKTGGTDRLRKRLAPVNGEIVELQVNGSELLIESIENSWAKEKGAGLYASAQYLVRK